MKAKYLIIGGITIAAIALMSFTKAKVSQAKELFSKILIRTSIPHIHSLSLDHLLVYLDITLQNPTAQDFTASSGGAIQAKVLRVFIGNKLLAHASLQSLSAIEIKAGGNFEIKNIEIKLPTMNLLTTLNDTAGGVQGLTNLFNKDNRQQQLQALKTNSEQILKQLRYEVDVELLGSLFTISKKVF